MGWNIYKFGERDGGSSSSEEFRRAARMAKEGLSIMCELAEQMEADYGERHGDGSFGRRHPDMEGYGERYGRRGDGGYYDERYGERAPARDSRGRYI